MSKVKKKSVKKTIEPGDLYAACDYELLYVVSRKKVKYCGNMKHEKWCDSFCEIGSSSGTLVYLGNIKDWGIAGKGKK